MIDVLHDPSTPSIAELERRHTPSVVRLRGTFAGLLCHDQYGTERLILGRSLDQVVSSFQHRVDLWQAKSFWTINVVRPPAWYIAQHARLTYSREVEAFADWVLYVVRFVVRQRAGRDESSDEADEETIATTIVQFPGLVTCVNTDEDCSCGCHGGFRPFNTSWVALYERQRKEGQVPDQRWRALPAPDPQLDLHFFAGSDGLHTLRAGETKAAALDVPILFFQGERADVPPAILDVERAYQEAEATRRLDEERGLARRRAERMVEYEAEFDALFPDYVNWRKSL